MQARQTGAALITVMLVAAVAIILLSKNIQRAAAVISQERSMNYQADVAELAYLAEAGALEKVREIAELDVAERRDQLNELVIDQSEIFEGRSQDYPGWQYSVVLNDLQAKLNVNQLIKSVAYQQAYERLAAGYSGAEVDSILDWIDSDTIIRSLGAEDERYQAKETPYLPANAALIHASELRMVDGFSDQAWYALQPYLVALPVGTLVNINTASESVLAALAPNLDVSEVIESREAEESGFSDQDSMSVSDEFAGTSESAGLFSLESNFYELDILIFNESTEYRSRVRIDIREEQDWVYLRTPVLDITDILLAGEYP